MTDVSETCKIPENNATEIIKNLWLGNIDSSVDDYFLKKHNIKHVFRILPIDNLKFCDYVNYYNYPIEDLSCCDLNMQTFFEDICKLIHQKIQNNEATLIHCKRGHHRSGCVVACYLMTYYKLNYFEAIRYINLKRPCAMRRNTCMLYSLYDYYLGHFN